MELRKVQPGQPVTAQEHNDLIDWCKKNEVRAGAGINIQNLPNGKLVSTSYGVDWWYGIIVCCGNCDPTDTSCDCYFNGCPDCCTKFTDNRYWVVRAYPKNANDPMCEPVKLWPYEQDHILYKKVVVTNLAENNCKTHILRPGTWVRVQQSYDFGSPAQLRYTIEHTEDCGDATCEEPSSMSSSSSSSSSSSKSGSGSSGSGSPCCPCVEITVNGGEKHRLQLTDTNTYTGDGYTLTLDTNPGQEGWFLGGPDIGGKLPMSNGACPPTSTEGYEFLDEGTLEDIKCCPPSSSSGSSTSRPPSTSSSASPCGESPCTNGTTNMGQSAAGQECLEGAATWNNTEGKCLKIKQQVRTAWCSDSAEDAPCLYAFYRIFQYDACGRLKSVSDETREEVVCGTPCPTGSTM